MTITFSVIRNVIRNAWALLSRSITSHRFPGVFFIAVGRLGIVDLEKNKCILLLSCLQIPDLISTLYHYPKSFEITSCSFSSLETLLYLCQPVWKSACKHLDTSFAGSVGVLLNFSQASLLGQKHRFMFCVKKQKNPLCHFNHFNVKFSGGHSVV